MEAEGLSPAGEKKRQAIETVEMHTGGSPVRIVVAGKICTQRLLMIISLFQGNDY